jgi:2-polyprenyl-3-methyl-5-hydroxy-6-metoxy-1,4-benzoquinol methylase
MDSCCRAGADCSGTSAFFSRWSGSYAKRFRKGKLDRIQKYLVEGIKREPLRGCSVLDIGCGVGPVHLTLLKEGAGRSLGVDLSDAMLKQAKQFAHTSGLAEHIEYLVGDFVQLSSSIPESDITVLDKVVCCYEDLDELILKSTGKTKATFALTHPKENLLTKGLFKGHEALAKLLRWDFHPFWHDWAGMKARILSQGFTLRYEHSTLTWHALVFQRIR